MIDTAPEALWEWLLELRQQHPQAHATLLSPNLVASREDSGARRLLPLVSEFPSTLVWNWRLGKMGLSCRLQAAGQWRGRVRIPLALAVGHVRAEPEPFVPVS